MKKVLIITYYWPPSGGAGVQRWLKFVKYLKEFGWEPLVYTVDNGEIPVEDLSLIYDIPDGTTILKQPIWEPYDLYKQFIGKKKDLKINAGFLSENKKPKLTEKIAVWIRGNFFIPDARRFWIKPSVKYLNNYLKQNKVHAIVSSGPPHSMHLIALQLKQQFSLPWLADFRDPWTNIDFYEQLMLTPWADRLHHKLEKKVLQTSDMVVTVGETMKREFEEMGVKHVEVVANGFDEEDIVIKNLVVDTKFSMAHIGSFVKSRNPVLLWKVLRDVSESIPTFKNDLEIKLVGNVDFNVTKSIEELGLSNNVTRIKYLPHSDVSIVQQQSQVLLLLLNQTKNAKGILTGKFFEYLAAKRPILAIGPVDSDVAKILLETNAGSIVDFNNEQQLKNEILRLYDDYKKGNLNVNSYNIEKYSRKFLTQKLALLLDQIAV